MPSDIRKPLAVELYAGTGSGTAGWCAAGGIAACFDLEYLSHHGDAPSGSMRVIQDVTTLHGSQFKDALWIWGSPPCQKYSYLAMPWSRSQPTSECIECRGTGLNPPGVSTEAVCLVCEGEGVIHNSKAAKALRRKWETEGPDNRLFDACFRIQREAIEASQCPACGDGYTWLGEDECEVCEGTGKRYIPLIVENVRGAVPWVGKQQAQFGSFYLWGDVAQIGNRVVAGRDLADIRAGRGRFGMGVAPESSGQKREGRNFHTWALTGGEVSSPSYHGGEHETRGVGQGVKVPGQIQGKEYAMCITGAAGQKTLGHINKRDGHGHTRHPTNQAESGAVREAQLERIADLAKVAPEAAIEMLAATKIGGDWFSDPKSTCRKHGSKSNARKAASAMIARIPYALAEYVAIQHYPDRREKL